MAIKKLLLLLIAAVGLSGCIVAHGKIKAEGQDVTITPQVGNFDAINVSSAFELNYTVGTPASVTCTAPASIVQYVKIETSGSTLKCYYFAPDNQQTDWNGRKVVVNVCAPSVNDFKASGASVVNINSPLSSKSIEFIASGASLISVASVKSNELEIDLSGASNISIGQVDVANLEVDASGASKTTVSGKATKIDVEVSGASTCDIRKLAISGGKIKASGASEVNANASADKCKISTSGASTVNH